MSDIAVFCALLIERVDVSNVHVQSVDHCSLLLGSCSNRLVHLINLTDAQRHAGQPFAGLVGNLHALLAVAVALTHSGHMPQRFPSGGPH